MNTEWGLDLITFAEKLNDTERGVCFNSYRILGNNDPGSRQHQILRLLSILIRVKKEDKLSFESPFWGAHTCNLSQIIIFNGKHEKEIIERMMMGIETITFPLCAAASNNSFTIVTSS